MNKTAKYSAPGRQDILASSRRALTVVLIIRETKTLHIKWEIKKHFIKQWKHQHVHVEYCAFTAASRGSPCDSTA